MDIPTKTNLTVREKSAISMVFKAPGDMKVTQLREQVAAEYGEEIWTGLNIKFGLNNKENDDEKGD